MTPEARLLALTDESKSNEGVYAILNAIAAKLDHLAEENQVTRNMIESHMKAEDSLIAMFRNAFPGGDPVGHCNWHLEEIERIRARKEFWKKMTFELSKWGLIGFVGWAVIQMWHGVLTGPK